MDEGVGTVDPCHDRVVSYEEALDGNLPEDVEPLFGVDNFESMFSCGVDRTLNNQNGCCCAAELVYLCIC